MQPDHSVKIKIRGAEFEASGDKESVTAQFEAFMKLAQTLPEHEPEIRRDPSGSTNGRTQETNDTQPLDQVYAKAFRTKGDVVSLNMLPQGDSARLDSVLLVLYGYSKTTGEMTIPIAQLLEGLKQSGIQIPTGVSKVVTGNESLVTRAGTKRASRYTLTNQGIKRAEEVLKSLA